MRDGLASETEEERAARLQQMSANQHHRLVGSEREARLQRNREGQSGQQSQLPLFEQPSVQAKMQNFHAEIAALEMQKCTTCLETFLGLQLRSHSTECHLNCQTPAFASLPSLIHFFTLHHIPRDLSRTSRAAPAAPHQPLCMGYTKFTWFEMFYVILLIIHKWLLKQSCSSHFIRPEKKKKEVLYTFPNPSPNPNPILNSNP